jgi:hypothetical protein
MLAFLCPLPAIRRTLLPYAHPALHSTLLSLSSFLFLRSVLRSNRRAADISAATQSAQTLVELPKLPNAPPAATLITPPSTHLNTISTAASTPSFLRITPQTGPQTTTPTQLQSYRKAHTRPLSSINPMIIFFSLFILSYTFNPAVHSLPCSFPDTSHCALIHSSYWRFLLRAWRAHLRALRARVTSAENETQQVRADIAPSSTQRVIWRSRHCRPCNPARIS